MSPSNERSAEFYRGAVFGIELMTQGQGVSEALRRYRALLAAAEAREAGKRGGVGSAENSSQVIENAITLGGVEATQPAAAEVVEAAERALKDERSPLRLCEPSCQKESVSRCMCRYCTSDRTTAALALCARWKEANGGK